MIDLLNTKYGVKRKLIIGGFAHWDALSKSATLLMYVQILDNNGSLLDDKSVNQNRQVTYNLNNENRVNAQFNPVQSGGIGEYDFFFNLISTTPLPSIILQLATKLKERGLFD